MHSTLISSTPLIEILKDLQFFSTLPHEKANYEKTQEEFNACIISNLTDAEADEVIAFLINYEKETIGNVSMHDLIERLECR